MVENDEEKPEILTLNKPKENNDIKSKNSNSSNNNNNIINKP